MRKKCTGPLKLGFLAAMLSASISAQAAAPAAPQGYVTAKEYLDIAGTAIADLTNNAKFPNSPDLTGYPARFEWPTSEDGTPPAGDVKGTYGVQIQGYFYPDTTDKYFFYIASDDNGALFISTDDNPANKVQVAREAVWNGVRSFNTADRRTLIDVGTPDERYDNRSKGISMQAGKAYYIEALMKEGGGGDNLAVAYEKGTASAPGDGVALDPIPGDRLSTLDITLGNVSVKTPPQSQTVNEGTTVTFSAAANGTPPFTYQWNLNGAPITDATSATYTIPFVSFADNNTKYSVTLTGGAGAPVTSANATLTVNKDVVAPTILEASGSGDFTHVTVKFSERIDEATATNPLNYKINNGISVTGAALQGDSAVVLTTSRQTGGLSYQLTVNNVGDRAATSNKIAANSVVNFNSAVFKNGVAFYERWNGATGIDDFVTSLEDPSFRPPDVTEGRSSFTGARFGDDLNNYGARVSGYFVPPTTGDYVFDIASDDNSYLFLSTDENPANKKKIANQPQWSDSLQWNDPDAVSTTQVHSDTYDSTEWETGVGGAIHLIAGNKYYMAIVWQDGTGGDGAEVYYRMAGSSIPANGTAANMTGNVIGVFVDPASLSPIITAAPTNQLYSIGETVKFSVSADSVKPMSYQWYKNGLVIPSATNSSLTFSNAGYDVIGDYSVKVSNANGASGPSVDDNSRALIRAPFTIEAEDFNFDGGKTMDVASQMPYRGAAYADIQTAILDVDYLDAGDASGGAAFAYGRFLVDNAANGVLEMKGPSDPADYQRGGFTVTNNYGIGWTQTGEWANYTRTFPEGDYHVFGGIAFGGRGAADINQTLYLVADATKPDGGTAGAPNVPGNLQGVTKIGDFKAPGTGAWSSNDIIPLQDANGALATVHLGGKQTIRWGFNKGDGDADFLLFYKVQATSTPPGNVSIVNNNNATVTITWTGGGTLQWTTNLVPASWQDTALTSPATVSVDAANKFYRAKK